MQTGRHPFAAFSSCVVPEPRNGDLGDQPKRFAERRSYIYRSTSVTLGRQRIRRPPARIRQRLSRTTGIGCPDTSKRKMCKSASCETCQKATWWGCGNHVPAVLDGVPKEQWCTCDPKVTKEGKEYPPMGKAN